MCLAKKQEAVPDVDSLLFQKPELTVLNNKSLADNFVVYNQLGYINAFWPTLHGNGEGCVCRWQYCLVDILAIQVKDLHLKLLPVIH